MSPRGQPHGSEASAETISEHGSVPPKALGLRVGAENTTKRFVKASSRGRPLQSSSGIQYSVGKGSGIGPLPLTWLEHHW